MTHWRMTLALAAGLSGLGSFAGPALAQAPQGSALVRALSDCRKLSDDAARLACYDAAAGRLESAERTGEVVVVDREQASAARRQAFGFNLPSLDMFRRGSDDAEADRLSLTVARASLGADGKWVFRMNQGQTWKQTDSSRLGRSPRAGSRFEVRRAAMGSYLANVDGQTAIRVRREQ